MQTSLATLLGAIIGGLCSVAIAFLYGEHHLGIFVSFLMVGGSVSLFFIVTGIIGVVLSYASRNAKRIRPTSTLAFAFFFPILTSLGLAWFVSLGTSAS